jgi:hypothetical protein
MLVVLRLHLKCSLVHHDSAVVLDLYYQHTHTQQARSPLLRQQLEQHSRLQRHLHTYDDRSGANPINLDRVFRHGPTLLDAQLDSAPDGVRSEVECDSRVRRRRSRCQVYTQVHSASATAAAAAAAAAAVVIVMFVAVKAGLFRSVLVLVIFADAHEAHQPFTVHINLH